MVNAGLDLFKRTKNFPTVISAVLNSGSMEQLYPKSPKLETILIVDTFLIIDFRFLRGFTIVEHTFRQWYHEEVNCIMDVSEEHIACIFNVEIFFMFLA
jgi:hypothetical protein